MEVLKSRISLASMLKANARSVRWHLLVQYCLSCISIRRYIIIIIIIVPSARISLTPSSNPSLSSIASGWSSRLHPVLYVGSRWSPCLCEGVYRSTSLMSLSLLFQQCPTCLVRLTRIVSMMGGKWTYSCCFVGCCLQD